MWIKLFVIKPIYLALLILSFYFCLTYGNWLAYVVLLIQLLSLFYHYGWQKAIKIILICACFFVTFIWRQEVWRTKEARLPSQVNQMVLKPDSIKINGNQLSAKASWQGYDYQVFYRLKNQQEKEQFERLNDFLILSVEAEVSQATPQRNFKGFNYQSYLKNQGISAILQVDKINAVSIKQNLSIFDYLSVWRRRLIVKFQKCFPSPMKHYVTGLLLGYLDNSFEEISDVYRDFGIIHLFALSGMHVQFFSGLVETLFLGLGIRKDRLVWLLSPLEIVYAGLTGWSVSVCRSVIQFILVKFELKSWDNLGITILLFLIFRPSAFLTIGGLLSFTYSLVLILLKRSGVVTGFQKCQDALALQLATLPLLIWYFSSYSPWAMGMTFLLSLFFESFLLPLLLLITLIEPVLNLSVLNVIFQVLEWLMTNLHVFLGGVVILGSPSLIILALIIVALGFLHDRWKEGKKLLLGFVCLVLLIVISKHPLQNEVTVLDIGQGDSILIRDIWGKTILIDTGGKVSFGQKESWQEGIVTSNAERTSIPYLKSRGISKIDYLVLTHTDADHIGDMENIAKHFSIGQVLVSPGSLTQASFVKRLKTMKVPIKAAQLGQKIRIMGSYLQVLYPSQIGDGGNNDSLVLYGKLLNKRFLFTGDLEDGELDLIKFYPYLPVDILKAGHHGSKGSSHPSFLNHIGAQEVLISAGVHNRYKHPHQETLNRFDQAGMVVYRTDQQGAIRYQGWRRWKVETVR